MAVKHLVKQVVRELRAIVERDPKGKRWRAWFDHEPQAVFDGDEALAAFDRLVMGSREKVPETYHLKIDDRTSRGGHIEVLLWANEPVRRTCPACGGSGKYVGLSVVEACRTCNGAGEVFTS
jgi:hypothetical protein